MAAIVGTAFLFSTALMTGAAIAEPPAIGPEAARHLLNRTGFEGHPAKIDAMAGLSRGDALEKVLAGAGKPGHEMGIAPVRALDARAGQFRELRGPAAMV